MKPFEKLDQKYGDSSVWQFIKFNLISFSITLLQLVLANILPFFFDSFTVKLPPILQSIFDAKVLFQGESRYVADGVVTWGYVLPFFLSNFIGNLYGYFANMKVTFDGEGSSRSLGIYCAVVFALILISTWLQGRITSLLTGGPLSFLARTIAACAAGMFQFIVIFPLEKFVLFRKH